jgi:acyl-CoA thioester hydrolase
MGDFETAIRVRYAETDQMGVVYHANVLVYLEVGRTEFLRDIGPPYSELERQGVLLGVVEAALRYAHPIRYDTPLLVRTCLADLGRASLRFGYTLRHAGTGQIHATGSTRHACLSPDLRVQPLPAALRSLLAPHLSAEAS